VASAGAAPRDPRAALPLVLALDVVTRNAPCGADVCNATSVHSCRAWHNTCDTHARVAPPSRKCGFSRGWRPLFHTQVLRVVKGSCNARMRAE